MVDVQWKIEASNRIYQLNEKLISVELEMQIQVVNPIIWMIPLDRATSEHRTLLACKVSAVRVVMSLEESLTVY